jgi:hypothetical protein
MLSQSPHFRRLRFESLESRRLLSVSPLLGFVQDSDDSSNFFEESNPSDFEEVSPLSLSQNIDPSRYRQYLPGFLDSMVCMSAITIYPDQVNESRSIAHQLQRNSNGEVTEVANRINESEGITIDFILRTGPEGYEPAFGEPSFTLNVAVIGGTADYGDDYTLGGIYVSSELHTALLTPDYDFPQAVEPETYSGNITINVLEDNIIEGLETITLEFSIDSPHTFDFYCTDKYAFFVSNNILTITITEYPKISLAVTDAAATERFEDIAQDYGKFSIKAQGNASSTITTLFDMIYDNDDIMSAQYGNDYSLQYQNTSGQWVSLGIPQVIQTNTISRYRFSASHSISQMVINFRVVPIFDWQDEAELFDPFGNGTPYNNIGELVTIELISATWSNMPTGWNPLLGCNQTGEIEIKDGAVCLITTDSNNDGTIDMNDRDPEVKNNSNAPGKVIRVNTDDDDQNGESDKWQRPNQFDTAMNPEALAGTAPSVTVENEDDLAETVLYVWVDNLTKADGTSLYFDVYSVFPTDLVMWTESTKGSRLHRGVESNGRITEQTRLAILSSSQTSFTRTVYMEANAAVTGTVTLQAMPVLNTNAVAGYDSVKINGITFGFTPYTPQTEYIAPMPIPEKNWKENEVGIRRNGDYDNGSTTVRDWSVFDPITSEDDLIRTDIDITPVSGISYVLKKSSTDVVMWTSSQKGESPYVVSATGTTIMSDETLWAEYVNFGEDTCTLTLVVIDTTSGLEFFTEELVYRPFNSVTIAFVGENEIAGDPVTSPGINDWVIQELLDGYDVHVYDDGYDVSGNSVVDCNKWGEGTALNEVANAVNNRGVNDVAILGYSHGGGSSYNLSWRMYYDGKMSDSYLYWNPPQVIFNSYNLVFTSYIDAVPNYYWSDGALGDSLEVMSLWKSMASQSI